MHTCSHNVLSLPSRAVKQVYIFTVAASKASLLLCVLLFSGMTWCVFFSLISNTLPAAFYGWAWMSNINFHISLFQITSTLHVTVASLLNFLISIVHLQKCYIKKKSTCYYFLLSLKVIPKPLLSCQGGTQSCDYWSLLQNMPLFLAIYPGSLWARDNRWLLSRVQRLAGPAGDSGLLSQLEPPTGTKGHPFVPVGVAFGPGWWLQPR